MHIPFVYLNTNGMAHLRTCLWDTTYIRLGLYLFYRYDLPRRRSVAARLLRSWVRIPPGVWMFVCCDCCVLSGRVLCEELITRLEESYRQWCVVVCDLETWGMRRPWPAGGYCAKRKKRKKVRLTSLSPLSKILVKFCVTIDRNYLCT